MRPVVLIRVAIQCLSATLVMALLISVVVGQGDPSNVSSQALQTQKDLIQLQLQKVSQHLFDNLDQQLDSLQNLASAVLAPTPAVRVLDAAKAIRALTEVSDQISNQNGRQAVLSSVDYLERALKAALPDRAANIHNILAPVIDAASANLRGENEGVLNANADKFRGASRRYWRLLPH